MDKRRNQTRAVISGLLVGCLLSGCASDGGLSGKDRPVDKEATRLALCSGAQKIDLAFSSIAQSNPGLFPIEAVAVESTFIKTVGFQPGKPDAASAGTVCAKQYSGDLDVAINTAVLATVNISKLIQAWNK